MLSAKQNFNQLFFFWTTTKPCLGVQTNGHETILIDKACLTPQVLLEKKDTLRKLSLNFECRTNALLNRKQKKVNNSLLSAFSCKKLECELLNQANLKNCSHRFCSLLEQTSTLLCTFFCEKQEKQLDFSEDVLALVFFLSSNFFVKATLRNWKKKLLDGCRYFFLVLPAKLLFEIQRLDLAFLKYSFVPWPFVSSFFVVRASLFGKNSLPTTTKPRFCSIPKRKSFGPKQTKKTFLVVKMETSGFKWFQQLFCFEVICLLETRLWVGFMMNL